MIERARTEARGHWEGYLVALGVVAAVSALIGAVLAYQRIGNLAMLYLLAILASAIRYGRGPAVVASVMAFLAFDWFFVEPEHTFTISDPAEWVALLLFLLTAVVTAQLAARERARAEEAERREREAVLLRAIGAALSEADLDLDLGLRAAEARLVEALGLAQAQNHGRCALLRSQLRPGLRARGSAICPYWHLPASGSGGCMSPVASTIPGSMALMDSCSVPWRRNSA